MPDSRAAGVDGGGCADEAHGRRVADKLGIDVEKAIAESGVERHPLEV